MESTEKTELQNVTDEGRAPKYRLATPDAAANLFAALKREDAAGDAPRRAMIQGMIDGNPPYDDAELRDMGLGHMVNVNFMTMRANLDARAASWHELFVEVPTLIECKPLSVAENTPDVLKHCAVVAEEFTEVVTDWDGFLPCMDLVGRDSEAYGLGIGLFENEWDWRLKAFHRGNLLIGAKASVEIDRNDLIMVRDEMSVAEVFALLDDVEVSESRGWRVDALRAAMVRVFQEGDQQSSDDKYQRSSWESVQQMMRNNDSTYQQKQFDKLRIVHIFVQEVSGDRKVSHLIIAESGLAEPAFLFEGYSRYDKLSNVVWWLPYNYGDGYARSVRGVASFMAQHDDLSNRFLCRVFDAGFMSASLLLRPESQLDLSRLQMVQHGLITVLPPGLNAIQSTFQPQIQPLIALRRVSEEVLMNNTGTYRQHNESVDRDAQKTARQVVEEVSKEARFEKAAIAAKYVHLDKLYREIMRRLCNKEVLTNKDVDYPGSEGARAFFERCLARGVPKEFIFDWAKRFRVTAFRSIGLGSLGVKYDITNQLLGASASFDEAGKRNAMRDWVAVRVGYKNADKYVAPVDRDSIASNEASIAMLEFNDVEEGSQVVVGADQTHKLHIDVFVQRLMPLLQAVQQQQPVGDPQKAYRTAVLALQHIAGHLQAIGPDKRYEAYVKQVAEFMQQAGQLVSILEQEVKRIAKAQADAQLAQQQLVADAEAIKRDRELEAKIYEINLKQGSMNKVREQKAAEQIAIARAKGEAGIKLKAQEQAVKLQLAAQKAQAEIALKQAAAERGA